MSAIPPMGRDGCKKNRKTSMKSLILAAGYATRLYPLTRNFPKPLLPVAGVTILDRLLADFDGIAAIDQHIIVTNHTFYEQFAAWKNDARYDREIILIDDGSVDNASRRGAVMDILHVIEQLGLEENLLVVAGDNVIDFSFAGLIEFAAMKYSSCITCHYEPSLAALQKTGVVELDENRRVLAMHEKPQQPPSHWAVPPFYLYRAEDIPLLFQAASGGCGHDAPGNLAAWLCQRTTMYAWELPGKRHDIGDLPSYERVNQLFSAARAEPPTPGSP